MLIYIIILLILVVGGITAKGKNEFFSDYLCPKNTATVNAIFSVLIFFSHGVQYVTLNGPLDAPYFALRSFLGQIVVVTYLFFSGYGIMESITKKGKAYVKAMPWNRFFGLWYQFALVVILYVLTNLAVGKSMTLKNVLLAFTGVTSVGNSNWYLFATFMLYAIVYLAFMLAGKRRAVGVLVTCALSVVYVAVLIETKWLPARFYNTFLCFPLGMAYSFVKPKVDALLMKNDGIWITAFVCTLTAFLYCSGNRGDSRLMEIDFYLLSVLVIVLFMMKVQIRSTVLDWFGSHIFSFFILQRIPMIALKQLGFAGKPHFFLVVCFFATVLLATLFDMLIAKLNPLIFKTKKA